MFQVSTQLSSEMNGCHNPHGETTEREPVTFTDDLSPKQRTVVRCTNVASNKRVMFPYTHSTHRKGSMRKYSAKGTYQNEGKRGEAIPESKQRTVGLRFIPNSQKERDRTRPDPTGQTSLIHKPIQSVRPLLSYPCDSSHRIFLYNSPPLYTYMHT